MADPTLYIANKNLSSWSMRPWLVMTHASLPVMEKVIRLDTPSTRGEIMKISKAAKVPVLVHDDRTIWDSLAICEYVAEMYRDAKLWPSDTHARAVARSVSCEMHSGFAELRHELPMNICGSFPDTKPSDVVLKQIDRIVDSWKTCRKAFGGDGEFLFGRFSIADAMYAPVVTRFLTYGVKIDSEISTTYMKAIMSLPAMQKWIDGAKKEVAEEK